MEARIEVLKKLGLLVGAVQTPECKTGIEISTGGHMLSPHTPIWEYCEPVLARPYHPTFSERVLFETFEPGTSLDEMLGVTRFFVFVGAALTPEFERLADDPSVVTLLFEPDPARLAGFLQDRNPRTFLNKKLFVFLGDMQHWSGSLFQALPPMLAEFGFPVFLSLPGMEKAYAEYYAAVTEAMEVYYYRAKIYGIEGQSLRRSIPLRDIQRGMFVDQYQHLYENTSVFFEAGDVTELENAFPGATAICIAAGKDLENRIEYIRAHQDKAVLIAVNSALRALLSHGLEPHFVVINDTSVGAGLAFKGLPRVEKSILVAHCLSHTGGDTFQRKYLFGDCAPSVFGKRGDLKLYGSVITTAYSLAAHLGCRKVVLAGAQLASKTPYGAGYSEMARHKILQVDDASGDLPMMHKYPQLYPVRSSNGTSMYTTMNFLDVRYWFLDYIRETGLEVVNTCPETILYGPHLLFEDTPQIDGFPGLEETFAALRPTPPVVALERVMQFMIEQIGWMKRLRKESGEIAKGLARRESEALARGAALLERYDRENVTYMVQRYLHFNNERFHEEYFESGDDERRRRALLYFMAHLRRMANGGFKILVNRLEVIKKLEASGKV